MPKKEDNIKKRPIRKNEKIGSDDTKLIDRCRPNCNTASTLLRSIIIAFILLIIFAFFKIVPIQEIEVMNETRTFVFPDLQEQKDLFFEEQCDEEEYSYSVVELPYKRMYEEGNRILHSYPFVIINNENSSGTFLYNQYFRAPENDYGCADIRPNTEFQTDRSLWSSVTIPGNSNRTILCQVSSHEERNGFKISEPMINPPTKTDCSPAIRSRDSTSRQNLTKKMIVPKIKIIKKEVRLIYLLFS